MVINDLFLIFIVVVIFFLLLYGLMLVFGYLLSLINELIKGYFYDFRCIFIWMVVSWFWFVGGGLYGCGFVDFFFCLLIYILFISLFVYILMCDFLIIKMILNWIEIV